MHTYYQCICTIHPLFSQSLYLHLRLQALYFSVHFQMHVCVHWISTCLLKSLLYYWSTKNQQHELLSSTTPIYQKQIKCSAYILIIRLSTNIQKHVITLAIFKYHSYQILVCIYAKDKCMSTISINNSIYWTNSDTKGQVYKD